MKPNGQIVLVVDDEQSIADTLVAIFRRFGMTAYGCYSAEEALRLMESFEPDVLVCDVMLTGISGIELAIELTKRKFRTRILLFSGQSGTADLLDQAKQQGYEFEILAKPVPPQDMVDRVRELLSSD